MISRALLCVALSLLFSLDTAIAKDGYRLSGQDVAVVVPAGENVERKVAKRVLYEVRRAFAHCANTLSVTTRDIFFTEGPRPTWMPASIRRDPVIRAILERRLRTAMMGRDPYLDRLARGETVIYILAPVDRPEAADLHRIHRETSHALLAQTLWRGSPIWLAEGIAEAMAEDGSEGESDACGRLREELKSLKGALPVEAVLRATTREEWGANSGRAVSWGIVRLLLMARKDLVPMLFHQCRALVAHLVHAPTLDGLTREFTEIVLAELTRAGATPDRLKEALRVWVEADFPTGSAFRRTNAYKLLSHGKKLAMFGTGFTARWGLDGVDTTGAFCQSFSGGQVVWRFPFPARMELHVGVRGRLGADFVREPEKGQEGWDLEHIVWDAKPKGRKNIPGVTFSCATPRNKYGRLYLFVKSPRENIFGYKHEQKLK